MRASALLVPLLAVGAIAGSVWLFGSSGPATDDAALLGRWDSPDRQLDLHEDGTYAMLVQTTSLECGRYLAMNGSLQMRAEGPSDSISLAMMRGPRLRLGKYAREANRLGVDLEDSSGARHAWLFTRGDGPPIDCTSQ